MKRLIPCVLFCCVLLSPLVAQSLDKPAATVKLTKTESISVAKLQSAIAAYEKQASQYNQTLTTDNKKQILDKLINSLLILQAAVRDKVTVSDAEMKTVIETSKKTLGALQGLTRALTDTELQAYLKANNMTYDTFVKQLKDQQTVYNYIRLKKKSIFDAVKDPTEQDVQDYYDANKSNYFMNDMVSLRHIFFDTRSLTSNEDRDKARKHAEDVLKELKAGATFAELVVKYSEDTTSKYSNGEFMTVFRNDTTRRNAYGAAFFDALFKLKKGEVSGVMQSNAGFHIVTVTERLDARLLGLNDKIPPGNQYTVRDAISRVLASNLENAAMQQAQEELVAELRKQAEIKIFDENIGW
jgi:peptidyl-prolyl cis-trans isomerase SurA